MKFIRPLLLIIVLAALLAACRAEPQPAPVSPNLTAGAPTREAVQAATPRPVATLTAQPKTSGALFVEAAACSACHTGMKDKNGQDVSIAGDWASSLHANAARDPYFRATLRSETLHFSAQAGAIEATCAICHMPMASVTTQAGGGVPKMFDQGFYNPANPLHKLGIDSISCSFCHQVSADNLGSKAGLSGGYAIDTVKALGQRVLYGPFPVDPAIHTMKQKAVGFGIQQSLHLSSAEFCATCHSLYTPTIDKDGKPLEKLFPEQTTYQEWLNSSYSGQTTCQVCHMPTAAGEVAISNAGGKARAPFRQHTFTGANATMLGIFQTNAAALNAGPPASSFQTAQAKTLAALGEQTAQVTGAVNPQNGKLILTVQVKSQAGHKLPSGFPARRAWLHVLIKDTAGQIVFESGGWDSTGQINGNANDADPAKFELHYNLITSPDQVQIYEAILGTPEGDVTPELMGVTTTLLRAGKYLKDNRLLPQGFDKNKAAADIAVAGGAQADPNFLGGSDILTYEITAPNPEKLSVTVELLYQSIGYRWAENFRGEAFAEAGEFLKYLDTSANQPALISRWEMGDK